MTTIQARQIVEQRKGARQVHRDRAAMIDDTIRTLSRLEKNTEEAARIILAVAQVTQEELVAIINSMVSSALEAVFPDPYAFEVEFVQRRGKTEADLYFVRDGKRVDPLSSAGGGAVDVAAFALRVALWSLKRPRPASTIILDEPFRFLSRELQPRAAEMVRELSRRLGVQFIMVTHSPDLIEAADKVFTVERGKDGISHVRQ